MYAGIANSRWTPRGFLWSRWRGKSYRHSWRMRDPQFYVSGKKSMACRTISDKLGLYHDRWCYDTDCMKWDESESTTSDVSVLRVRDDTIKPLIWVVPNRTTSMFLVSSCICLWSIYWSQVLSWRWRWIWSSADRWCSNYIWVINNFIAYQGATYITGLTL